MVSFSTSFGVFGHTFARSKLVAKARPYTPPDPRQTNKWAYTEGKLQSK
ncbi:MAG: hypothetical protein GY774_09565 [Planctomycetes bacterium]|nr:hypothetical protein [Planctomycetota bacterium]